MAQELRSRKVFQLVEDLETGELIRSGLFTTEYYTVEVEYTKAAAQIAVLEQSLLRPLREYALDNTNTYALNKITDIEAQIVALRNKL